MEMTGSNFALPKSLLKEPAFDRLLIHITNSISNNWDEESLEDTLYLLRVKSVIDKYFKIFSPENVITQAITVCLC